MSHPSQLVTFPPPPPIFASTNSSNLQQSNSSKITVTSTGPGSGLGTPCSGTQDGHGGGSIGSGPNSCGMVGGSLVNGNTICIPASSATICTAIPVMGNGGGGSANLGLIGAVCFSETVCIHFFI